MVDTSVRADAGRAIGRYRQTVSDPMPLFTIVGMAVVVYTFAGFFVYWLITGSGTVGIGGRVSDLGSVIWAGPLFAWGAIYLTGRRGPFIRLWREPVTVTVDSQTLAWNGDGTTGSTSWDAVAEIRPSLRVTMRDAIFVAVEAADGQTIACLPMKLTEVDGSRWRPHRTTLIDLAVAVRPDRFRIARHPFRRIAVLR